MNVIYGEEPFAEDEDWGYGPPRYLRPERVRLAAEGLRTTRYAELISGVDPAELTAAEVYPRRWSEHGALEWGRAWYDGLTQFFEAAARADDAMLVWLDRRTKTTVRPQLGKRWRFPGHTALDPCIRDPKAAEPVVG
ncbi:DUF1877 family protein [Streptomyces dubilierae]|uniref:DUF1877 family protein n=1 Tax=Streptomyces dubilierae TaxID=3075533 RepID=A0ABU2P2T3_9ACTN|nr:DUF1877 family protein [Streptomyces sp. DSM 41921]MDT0385954.1 DUF1877 family protein [Streptomyces sp. DSM 41921]